MSLIPELPNELGQEILGYLRPSERLRLQGVSRDWRRQLIIERVALDFLNRASPVVVEYLNVRKVIDQMTPIVRRAYYKFTNELERLRELDEDMTVEIFLNDGAELREVLKMFLQGNIRGQVFYHQDREVRRIANILLDSLYVVTSEDYEEEEG